MEFKLTIDMDNSAFEAEGGPHEIARILKHAAEEMARRCGKLVPACGGYLRDVNGNVVGGWGVRGPQPTFEVWMCGGRVATFYSRTSAEQFIRQVATDDYVRSHYAIREATA